MNQHNYEIEAVKEDGIALEYVKEQTPELCLIAVKQNGYALMSVKEQTPELCLAAVRQNGYALEYVKEQTPEICLAAVKQNGLALKYARFQTPEICLAAVTRNSYALEYARIQTPELCLEAVKTNGLALKHVKKQTLEEKNMNIDKDKLAELFELQAQLNEKLNVTTGSKTDEEIAKQVLLLSRSLIHEVIELEDELQLSWKYWKKSATINISKAREEATDCLFFLISILQQLEMTSNDVYEQYTNKHKINLQRQERGY